MTPADDASKTPATVRATSLHGALRVEPLQPALGAEVSGVSVADALQDKDLADELKTLWRTHKVLFFRDQDISHAEHQAFARLFGDLEPHPVFKGDIPDAPLLLRISNYDPDGKPKPSKAYENIWHSDVTFQPEPAGGSVLRMLEGPALGGDTLWSNMVMAYETLEPEIKTMIDPTTATMV